MPVMKIFLCDCHIVSFLFLPQKGQTSHLRIAAVPNALLGVISKRSGVRAEQWPLRANVGPRGEFSDMILALWEQIKDF